jgi:hypothetical protein
VIAELLAALKARDLDLNSLEIADALWLASRISPRGPAAEAGGPRAEEPEDAATVSGRPPVPEPPVQPPAPEPRHVPAAGSGAEHVYLYRRSRVTARAEGAGSALPLRVAGAASIANARALARALRPLRIHVPSRQRWSVDEEETAHRYAETRILLPVLVPLAERWLELVLVVDGARSMRVWEQTVDELQKLLERQGAFRAAQRWTLDTEAGEPALHRGRRRRAAPPHSARELVDPAGDRFILVVSDCVAPAWDDGRMGRLLREWGRNELVVLLQVLPERLWPRTGLGSAEPVYLSQPVRGGNNDRMHVRRATLSWDDGEPSGLAVPVTGLDADSLARMAGLIAARAGSESVGYRIPDATPDRGDSEAPAAAAEQPTALARLRRFQATASSTAQKLAHYLAAAPLSLPILRLVRRSLLPDADDGHLAEVLLGGLLYEQEGAGEDDAIAWEFHDGVRRLLLEGSPLPDTVRVQDRVSEYLVRNRRSTLDFRAVLLDPDGVPREVAEDELPFARVQAEVLRAMGGEYARIAGRMSVPTAAGEAPTPPEAVPTPATETQSDPYETLFLDDGWPVFLDDGWPVIDRDQLRLWLRQLHAPAGPRMLVVDGPPQSGKSFTKKIIEHVASREGFRVVSIVLPMREADVVSVIAREMGFEFVPELQHRHSRWTVDRLAEWMMDQTRSLGGAFWLIVDGVDKSDEWLSRLFQSLAREVHRHTTLRLALLDYSGPLPDEIEGRVLKETVKPLDRGDVARYFERVLRARGDLPSPERIDLTVDQVMEMAGGNRDAPEWVGGLARAVQQVTGRLPIGKAEKDEEEPRVDPRSELFTLEALRTDRGDAMLLHFGSPDEPRLLLVDGGGAGVYRKLLRPRLQELREERGDDSPLPIELVLLTHMHDPQSHGILDLLRELVERQRDAKLPLIHIRNLWHNDLDVGRARRHEELRQMAKELDLPFNRPFDGWVTAHPEGLWFAVAPGLRLRVVWPTLQWLERGRAISRDDKDTANRFSIAVVAESNGRTMLLPSDAAGEDLLSGLDQLGFLDESGGLHVDLFKLPHQGDRKSVDVEFLQRVTADHYLVSASGRHGFPHPETFELLFAARGDAPFSLWFCQRPEDYDTAYDRAALAAVLERRSQTVKGFRVRMPAPDEPSIVIDL